MTENAVPTWVRSHYGVVIEGTERADRALVDDLGALGSATVHEAMGRKGFLGPELRPIFNDASAAGTAITVVVPPGDNWMIHVAVEVCRPGDLMVVVPWGPSNHGYFGELLATSLQYREVAGLVIDGGCRDVSELRDMNFPVWSRCISVQGTVKEELGVVNIPVPLGGVQIHPGDAVIADDDGVVVVPRESVPGVLDLSRERSEAERKRRQLYGNGELSLDLGNMRPDLERLGLRRKSQRDDQLLR